MLYVRFACVCVVAGFDLCCHSLLRFEFWGCFRLGLFECHGYLVVLSLERFWVVWYCVLVPAWGWFVKTSQVVLVGLFLVCFLLLFFECRLNTFPGASWMPW